MRIPTAVRETLFPDDVAPWGEIPMRIRGDGRSFQRPRSGSDQPVLILQDDPPPSDGLARPGSGFVTPADSPTTAPS
ncbi:hypothetical protein HMPREF1549_01726 [Actinomyces johnsonii F0510]|uniref:Uncharacterized protein n=2 Tax=Actinomyces johnsonii TaxID=544581 RepID=U1Q7I3_9ACTO|nr:hypothetical protein HMPREF1549_01726 [Actinomyces johnsonii F0510]